MPRKCQVILETCSTCLIVFEEEQTVFGNGRVTFQDVCYWSDSPLIQLCLVLGIYGDKSWRWEAEIGISGAIIHSCF